MKEAKLLELFGRSSRSERARDSLRIASYHAWSSLEWADIFSPYHGTQKYQPGSQSVQCGTQADISKTQRRRKSASDVTESRRAPRQRRSQKRLGTRSLEWKYQWQVTVMMLAS